MLPLKILYLGSQRHPWCTEVHIAQDLRNLGHEVMIWQEPTGGFKQPSLDDIEAYCYKNPVDLVMFTRTWGGPLEMTGLWRRLEDMGIVTASYHLDLYVGLERQVGIDNDPFWTTQYVFTPDGDPESAKFFASRGINHIWSPPGVFSEECIPGMWRDEYNYDVVFVGSYGYHAEHPWRTQLIDHLADRYGERFRRFGGDQPEGPTRGNDLNDLYATAKVVVGDSLCLPGHTNYWSDRVCETLGRGGLLVHPRVPGLAEYMELKGGKDLFFYDYGNLDEVDSIVDFCLQLSPEKRQAIASRGQAKVRAKHTYMDRLARALKLMDFDNEHDPVEDAINAGLIPRSAAEFIDSKREASPPIHRPLDSVGRVTTLHASSIDKLELGSGYHPLDGFVHLDINPHAPNVDIVGTAYPLNMPDGFVHGEIRAVDVLEHMTYLDTDKILAEWFRVMASGARLYVQVPDAHVIMRWYAVGDRRLLERLPANIPQTVLGGATWRLLGGHRDDVQSHEGEEWRFNAHYALFSEQSLGEALERAGFVIESNITNIHPNLMIWSRKP